MSKPLQISGRVEAARDPSLPMTEDEAGIVVRMMEGNVPFFPRGEEAQALIADELISMGVTLDQGMWLARRYAQLYRKEWAFNELRALYCTRYRPADGIEGFSGVYLDGIPSDRANRPAPPAIAAASVLLVEAPTVTMEELAAMVAQAVKPMPPPQPRTAEEIAAELYRRRTPEQVARDMARLREEEAALLAARKARA